MKQRLITEKEIIGAMAKWAVRQHPYHKPPRLDEVTDKILKHTKATFPDGFPNLRMRMFGDSHEIFAWLRDVFGESDDIMKEWNTSKQGGGGHVFVSRYSNIDPDSDFIDISALFGNVAREAWDEGSEDNQ